MDFLGVDVVAGGCEVVIEQVFDEVGGEGECV